MVERYPSLREGKRAKLVCTLGPASVDRVVELVDARMDVARINLSHGTPSEHERTLEAVRGAAARTGRTVGALADLSGPKVRLGAFAQGAVELAPGEGFVLGPPGAPGSRSRVSTTYDRLAADLRPEDRVHLADGAIELRVVACHDDGDVQTEVVRGGTVRSRAGLNLPSARLGLPALTTKDRADLDRVVGWGIDLVALSFVRSPADVRELRGLLGDAPVGVVAKIETDPAVEGFTGILQEADAVMIARGDLGVEVPFEEVPVLQKELVRRAVEAGVPVVVATHMLESMVTSARPTRAEASDVANAILDGADAILLSAETAIGEQPVRAAATASRIAAAVEEHGASYLPKGERRPPGSEPHAVARAASSLADEDPRIEAILCFTRTGRTAGLLAAARPHVPILAFSPDESVLRRLGLLRAVVPCPSETPSDTDGMIAMMDDLARQRFGFAEDALVVMVASNPVGAARTNLLKLHRLGG